MPALQWSLLVPVVWPVLSVYSKPNEFIQKEAIRCPK